MTPAEFRAARLALGLTQTEMGQRLGGERPYALRTVQSWESGERGIPPAVAALVKHFL